MTEPYERTRALLAQVYGSEIADAVYPRIAALLERLA